MVGYNHKVLTISNFSTASATTEYEELKLINVDRIEIQVDWAGLTGTLDGVINIFQRQESSMTYILADAVEMSALLDTASGSKLFTLWKWTASDIKIQIVKNNLTGGSLTAAIGTRG